MKNITNWISLYVGCATVLGICATLYAIFNFPSNWAGLLAFVIPSAVAELTGIELYISSRIRFSVSTIFTMAAILISGPTTGAFIHLVDGLVSTAISAWQQRNLSGKTKSALLRRSLFNTSMYVIAALLAGEVYVRTGGSPGYPLNISNLFPFIFAIIVYYSINFGMLVGIVSLQTGRQIRQIWRQDFQWALPIFVIGTLLGGGGLALGYYLLGISGLVIFMLPVLATGYAFRTYVKNTRQYVDELEKVNTQLKNSNLGLLQSLGAVIDAFDVYTYGHSTQVAAYAREIAAEMGLSKETQEKIMRGGLIHDVGKIGVKDAIIGKDGRLTDEEYEALKRHTTIGAEIVIQMEGLQDLVPLVRNHHERWDGNGYPDRLQGKQIPLEARILAIADSVDAMLSDRSYRAPRLLSEVVNEIHRCTNTQFDPDVVQAFLRVVEKRGESFFVNSAKRVDIALANNGIIKPAQALHYLKKSMLPANILYPANELKVL